MEGNPNPKIPQSEPLASHHETTGFDSYLAASKKRVDILQSLCTLAICAITLCSCSFDQSVPLYTSFDFETSERIANSKNFSLNHLRFWLERFSSVRNAILCNVVLSFLTVVILASAIHQPWWYLRHGRTTLLLFQRFVYKTASIAAVWHIAHSGSYCALQVGAGSSAVLSLMWDALMCPLPVHIHAPAACISWAILTTFQYMAKRLGPTGPASVATSYFIQFVLGVAIPTLLLLQQDRSLRRRFIRHGAAAQRLYKQHQRLPHLQSLNPKQTKHELPASSPDCQPAYVPEASTQPANPQSSQQPKALPSTPSTADSPCTQQGHVAAACPVPLQGPAHLGASGAVNPPQLFKAVYSSCSVATCISVKILDHCAFEHREQLATALQAACTPLLPEDAPPIHIAAMPGCLQLILSARSLRAANTPQPRPPALIIQAIYNALPSSLLASGINIQYGSCFVSIPPGTTAPETSGSAAGTAPGRPPVENLIEAAAKVPQVCWGLLMDPVCVEAGRATEQCVWIRLDKEGAEAAGKLALVFQRDGQVEHVQRDVDAAEMARGPWVTLPPGLDAAPVSIHLFSTRPGKQGLLLATAATMALPRTAAAELCATFNDADYDATLQHGLRMLLEDISAVWHLPAGGAPGAHALALVHEVAEYLRTTEKPETHAAFAAHMAQYIAAAGAPAEPRAAPGRAAGALLRAQPARGVDGAAAVAHALLVVVVVYKVAVQAEHPGQSHLMVVFPVLLHLLAVGLPFAVLALGADSLRRRRAAVMLAQAAAVSSLYLAGCWVERLRPWWALAPAHAHRLLINGIFRPCLAQAAVPVQLVMTLLEEVAKATLTATACGAGSGSSSSWCMRPSTWIHLATVVLAGATSCLVRTASPRIFRCLPGWSTSPAAQQLHEEAAGKPQTSAAGGGEAAACSEGAAARGMQEGGGEPEGSGSPTLH